MWTFRRRFRSLAATTTVLAGIGAFLGFQPAAQAAVTLDINTVTGDLQLIGQPGDTLSGYEILTSGNENSFIYASPANANNTWDTDRFGGTPVSAPYDTISGSTFQVAASMAAGNGTWHSMGTNTWTTLGSGQQVTNQLGEMCAVRGIADGVGDIRTPVIYNFSTEPAIIDLGDHFIPGSATDILFAYDTQPGFMNTALFSGTTFNSAVQNYSCNVSGSPYYGEQFSGPGVLGAVQATPEPASVGLLALGGITLLARRRRAM